MIDEANAPMRRWRRIKFVNITPLRAHEDAHPRDRPLIFIIAHARGFVTRQNHKRARLMARLKSVYQTCFYKPVIIYFTVKPYSCVGER